MHRDSCPLDCKVYVGNLGNNGNKTELERSFGYYGPLRSVWVARNPPGFAFVEFEDPRDAADAVRELDGRVEERSPSVMADRKKSRRMGSTRKGQRRLQNPECRLGDEEGPLEGVMEESAEKAQETPDELHKIQEVQGERGFSTQGGCQKLLVDPPVSVGELEQGLGWEGSGFITSKDLPSGLREFVEVQPSPSVKERGEERVAPAPMLSQPRSTEPPGGAEDEENAMVHRKRKLGSTCKLQRRMQNPEGLLRGEEEPPGGVMEDSEEKVQESNDPRHKIQDFHWERGFSTQGDSQKEELDHRLKMEVASQNISPPPREFVEVQPSPSVKETGEEEERVIPAPMFSQPESTEPPKGAEDEDNAMVHRKRKLGSTRKGQRRMQILEGQLVGEEGPPGDVMEESEEKLQETPDERHKIQEVQEKRGFSTQGDSQKAEGPLEDVMEESEEKVLEIPDELHKIQEVHGERGFSTQGDSQKEEGPLEDVMEETEEKLQETPDELHKIQDVHGERGFSTQEDSEKEELDHRLKMEVASQNISPPPWELVEVQPSPSVKEKGEEEERVSPAPMFSQPESTKPPRGAEDEDNAMVHRKRKLGSTRKGQHRMHVSEGQLVGEEGPPGGVMEESEEKLQETPDEIHKIQEVQEKRGFSTQGDSQKEELDQGLETEVAGQNISPSQGEFVEVQPSPSVKEKGEEEGGVSPAPMLSHPQSTEPPRGAEDEDNAMVHRKRKLGSTRKGQRRMQVSEGQLVGEEGPPGSVMEESEEKLQETPDELHKIQGVQEKRGFSTQGGSQKAEGPLEDVMEESEEKVLETPDELHKIQEVHGERGFSTQRDSQKAEGPLEDVMEETEEKLQETPDELHKIQEVHGERGFSTQVDHQKEDGPLEDVMEKSEEKVQETPDPFHKIQEVHGERGFSTQEDSEKEELDHRLKMEVASQNISPPPWEFVEVQPSPSVKEKGEEEERVSEKRGFSTQGDSQKAEGHLEDVMEESEEKVLQTPAELHENQEVHGERGFSTQGDSQKEELDQWLETEVAGQNISPSQGEFVEVQPSPSVKEKGEEEERVSPAPMLSHPQSTEPPRGAEDEDNAMVHRKRKLGSTRKGQRRMHVSEGQLVGEEGPPGGVMEESEEKLQETPDERHKIQEFHGERSFTTQEDSQKEELDHRLKMEVASQNISPPPWKFVEVQPSPSVKEKGGEEERGSPAPMLSQPQSTEPPQGR
ncbi:UNVERIFIED_CONTAM: hypothetical protein FKN15_010718 [Acipenser sinensis]